MTPTWTQIPWNQVRGSLVPQREWEGGPPSQHGSIAPPPSGARGSKTWSSSKMFQKVKYQPPSLNQSCTLTPIDHAPSMNYAHADHYAPPADSPSSTPGKVHADHHKIRQSSGGRREYVPHHGPQGTCEDALAGHRHEPPRKVSDQIARMAIERSFVRAYAEIGTQNVPNP